MFLQLIDDLVITLSISCSHVPILFFINNLTSANNAFTDFTSFFYICSYSLRFVALVHSTKKKWFCWNFFIISVHFVFFCWLCVIKCGNLKLFLEVFGYMLDQNQLQNSPGNHSHASNTDNPQIRHHFFAIWGQLNDILFL